MWEYYPRQDRVGNIPTKKDPPFPRNSVRTENGCRRSDSKYRNGVLIGIGWEAMRDSRIVRLELHLENKSFCLAHGGSASAYPDLDANGAASIGNRKFPDSRP